MALPDSQPLAASQPSPGALTPPLCRLVDLQGLRTAPQLQEPQRQALREALIAAMAPCSWFTIGVMAPSAVEALAALRCWEAALGWTPLQPAAGAAQDEGPVFLKGNQRSGAYLLRLEAGLGCGVLVSGQHPDDPSVQDTWGPFPLDLFR
ncbi:MAG: DUF1824 family protein [Synechococcaceae cyanobacterium]|nr:DUF1824 family protein [Synechococcaceae cyanobacterium]